MACACCGASAERVRSPGASRTCAMTRLDDARGIALRSRSRAREYGACAQQRQVQRRAAAAGPARSIAWRGCGEQASASRLTGVTAAAALMSRMMRCASSSTVGARRPRRAPSSPSRSRQSGRCASSSGVQRDRARRCSRARGRSSRAARFRLAQEAPQRLLLLRLARQLAHVAVDLHDPLVADVHRHEDHRPHAAGAGSCAASSTACRSWARASGRCGCGRPR